jgi:hypothetical protein
MGAEMSYLINHFKDLKSPLRRVVPLTGHNLTHCAREGRGERLPRVLLMGTWPMVLFLVGRKSR